MNTSINEAEALARKAARGAGYSWSMADEAAFAAGWLCQNGLDGAAIMAAHLQYASGCGVAAIRLHSLQQPWRAKGSSGLCALSAGASVSDLALEPTSLLGQLEQVITPALLLPYIGYVTQRWLLNLGPTSLNIGQALVKCPTFEAEILSHAGLTWLSRYTPTQDATLASDNDSTNPQHLHNVQYRISENKADTVSAIPLPRTHRANISPHDWATLNRFAALTYAPATEASRQSAGAGNTDND